jgi:hypothetical protein
MVKIKKINWLSRDAKEAEVCLSDGKFEIICFSHPFDYKIGHVVKEALHAFNVKEVYKVGEEENFLAKKLHEEFEYKLVGKVIDKEKVQVKVGDFVIELDCPFPGDIELGDYVSVLCGRIDLY